MPGKKVKRYRGPSRPVDPRYAPSPVVKKGPDTFGIALVGIAVAVVLIIILWAALNGGNTTATPTGVTTQVTSVSASDQQTAQAVNVATQVVKDATETAGLPRIEPTDALALYNAGNVTIVDVRGHDDYLKGHIKGATNIQESDAINNLSKFPKLGNLVVYCL